LAGNWISSEENANSDSIEPVHPWASCQVITHHRYLPIPAQRQPPRRTHLPGRIEVHEGETLAEALHRFRHVVRHASRRQWSKTRPGGYETPSDLRRRHESTRNRNARIAQQWGRRCGHVTVYMTLAGLFASTDPFTGPRQFKRRYRR
jgi:ribosomal protein S21